MPRIRYTLKDGTPVRGTTTIASRFADKAGLLVWANREGLAGRDMNEARDKAASIGTLTHSMVEARLHGRPIPPPTGFSPEDADKAHTGYRAFLEWEEQSQFIVTGTEMNLVSEAYKYGGTPDGIGTIQGKHVLFDLKTSNATYPEVILQLAAYRTLLVENGYPRPEKIVALRVGKDWGDFHYHSWPFQVIDLGWEAFEMMLRLYPIMADLKKLSS